MAVEGREPFAENQLRVRGVVHQATFKGYTAVKVQKMCNVEDSYDEGRCWLSDKTLRGVSSSW